MVGGQSEAALEVGSQLVTLAILTLIYAGTFLLYGRNAALVTPVSYTHLRAHETGA